jgi:quercetin dioxygenase-like cupin family protein
LRAASGDETLPRHREEHTMLFSAWTITSRHRRLVALLVAILVIASVGGLIAAGRGASAANPPMAQRIDLAAGLPGFAPGYRLSLTEAVVPPGAGFAPHRHPGMQVAYIESGTLQFTVFRGRVKVFRGHPGATQELVRVIRAGRTGSIRTGEWIIETPSVWHRGANVGRTRVVILLATLLRKGEPPAIPVTP